jgi:hypothetical protein
MDNMRDASRESTRIGDRGGNGLENLEMGMHTSLPLESHPDVAGR